MKVKSYKKGVVSKRAICRDCTWSWTDVVNANVKGRYHASNSGHTVDVLVLHQSVIRRLIQK